MHFDQYTRYRVYIFCTLADILSYLCRIIYKNRVYLRHLHLNLEVECFIGRYLYQILVYILANELTHQTNSPNRYIDIHCIHSRDWQFTTSEDTILATYSSTRSNMSRFSALVSKAEACMSIYSIDEWVSRELIPCSTWLYGIEYVWLYHSSLGTVGSRGNHSRFLDSIDSNR